MKFIELLLEVSRNISLAVIQVFHLLLQDLLVVFEQIVDRFYKLFRLFVNLGALDGLGVLFVCLKIYKLGIFFDRPVQFAFLAQEELTPLKSINCRKHFLLTLADRHQQFFL